MRLPHKFVVAELLHFYHLHDNTPQFQRDLLEVWKGSHDSYRDAYAEVVRTINAEKPH